MSEPLDETYLTWLYSQVGSVKLRNRARTYWSLLRQLYKVEFVWLVPNDDNRAQDGCDLRYRFFEENDVDVDSQWMDQPCSFLEMLVALAQTLAFEEGNKASFWFWHMLENVELDQYTDLQWGILPSEKEVEEIVNNIIWRTYTYQGEGGLFPLRYPEHDQRYVELWYQLNAYLIEREA